MRAGSKQISARSSQRSTVCSPASGALGCPSSPHAAVSAGMGLDSSNACAASDLDSLKQNLLAQLYSPVRWTASMHYLAENGVTALVECGPGKVLSGLGKRCIKEAQIFSTDTPEALAATAAALA